MHRILAFLLLTVLAGCSSFVIRTDFNKTADFSQLKNYQWLPQEDWSPETRAVRSPLVQDKVQAAVDRRLQKMGYTAGTAADFFVDPYVTVAMEQKLSPGAGPNGPPATIHEIVEGTLLIRVLAPDRKDVLWTGSAQAEILSQATAAEREDRINKAVEEILEQFPPPKK